MEPTPEFEHLQAAPSHELREALTLSKGWLQAVLRNWRTLDDHEREAMVTAALSGTDRIAFLLDIIDGEAEEVLAHAAERAAAERAANASK